MPTTLDLGDITLDAVRKDIRYVHLSVHPPTGRVRVSAPLRMSLDTIRLFAISRLGWIKEQQQKLRGQELEMPREYLDRESHYAWGRRHLLAVVERDTAPSIELAHNRMLLRVRRETDDANRGAIIEAWYREQIRHAAPPLIAQWPPLIGVKVRRLFVQRMKTKWGSCNTATGCIRLNTDLARKLRECLEYVIVPEMVHLLEPTHNARFRSLIDCFMPRWRLHRELLNQLPVRHEHWEN